MNKLYTCQSGKELQELGDFFYASKEPNGSHLIPFEVAEERTMVNEYAEKYSMILVMSDTQVNWLPQ